MRSKHLDRRADAAALVGRWLGAAAFVLTLAAGCQTLLPSKLTNFGEDRRILKQAQNDPFPSPADVGIETPKETK
jgi:hypothetical protein